MKLLQSFFFLKIQKKLLKNWQRYRGGVFFWVFFLPFTKQKPENLKGFESFFQVARSSEASEQPKVSFRCLGYVYIYIWDEILTCYVGIYNNITMRIPRNLVQWSLWKDHLCKMGSVMVVLLWPFLGWLKRDPLGFWVFGDLQRSGNETIMDWIVKCKWHLQRGQEITPRWWC